jgi:hypothetical protein
MKQSLAIKDVTVDDSLAAQVRAMRRREAASGIWEPPAVVAVEQRRTVTIPIERQMIAIILRPIADGQRAGHDSKECELRALFETLTPAESLTLRRRLDVNARGDELAQAFQRLVVERRGRLLRHLDDVRWRRRG